MRKTKLRITSISVSSIFVLTMLVFGKNNIAGFFKVLGNDLLVLYTKMFVSIRPF